MTPDPHTAPQARADGDNPGAEDGVQRHPDEQTRKVAARVEAGNRDSLSPGADAAGAAPGLRRND
jgi:hypothetical protein